MKVKLSLLLFFLSILIGSAEAATIYADGNMGGNCTSGNYSIANRNCSGSDGNAYGGASAVQNASNAASAGDTISIRSSSTLYTGAGTLGTIQIKSGSSLANRITYAGYQNENPIVKGFEGGLTPNCEVGSTCYVTIRNLIVDGQNTQGIVGICCLAYSTIRDMELRWAGMNGIAGFHDGEIINVHNHHNGHNTGDVQRGHGLYSAGSLGNITIDGGEWHHMGSYGVHCRLECYGSTIKNMRVHSNIGMGILVSSETATLPGTVVYNNVIYNNSSRGLSMSSYQSVAYNNTVVSNGTGICIDNPDVIVRNNIVLNNTTGQIVQNCDNAFGTNPTTDHNITSGSLSTYFADAPNGDFRLCTAAGAPHVNCAGAASLAIDQGVSLSATVVCSNGLPCDIVGTVRPQGNGWDIGAYEGSGSQPVTTACNDGLDNDGDGLIDFPADPGCTDANDTNEFNVTTPPTPAQVVAISCDNVVTDSSGNANHGTLTNGATYNAQGKYNQACSFDGVNDSVTIASSASLNTITHGFTLSAWVKPTTLSAANAVIAKNNPAVTETKWFLFSSITGSSCGATAPYGGFVQGTVFSACHGIPLTLNEWTHVALTYNSQAQNPQLTLYKNGVPVSSGNASSILDTTSGTLQIGNDLVSSAFHGLIDEIRIYNCGLDHSAASSTCNPAGVPTSIVAAMNTPINPLAPDTVVIKLNVSALKSTGTTWKFGTPP